MTTIAERKEQVELIWQSSFQQELNDALTLKLRQAALVGVKAVLETALREELTAQLGFGSYERRGSKAKPLNEYRSGYFQRQVNSEHGHIPDLKVPKLRRGNQEREWHILIRYQSCLQSLLDTALYIYVLGLSLRDLQEALYLVMGQMLSVTAINRITNTAQSQLQAWQQQPLTATPPVLVVDGVWVKLMYPTQATWVDQSGHTRVQVRCQERVILAALAVWPDGGYHLLHYEVALAEDEASWLAFGQHLLARGLDPQVVQLVVSDGSKGVLPTLKQYLPQAKLQRCTVHKIRGFERYLGYQDLSDTDPCTAQPWSEEAARAQRRADISTDAHYIFKATTRAEAHQRLTQFVAKWQPLEPRAVKNFIYGLKRCFEFYEFDPALHSLIHSTNLLERFFREFRAKADEIGSFPNETSCLMIFYLVMVRDHAKHNRLNFAKT